jgi:hypothetical protein
MSKKKYFGKCHICGENKKLSYEHVPPKKAFNDKATTVYKALDIIEGGGLPWNVENIRGKNMQNGMGAYTLCIDCNSKTGSRYVNDFIDVSVKSSDSSNITVSGNFKYARIEIYDISLVNFSKQVLAMFASVNSEDFFDAQTDLRELVMNYEETGIDKDKYAIYMYMYKGGTGRSSGISAMMKNDGTLVVSSEFVTIPFGFVLVLNPNRETLPEYGVEITDFLNDYKPSDRANIRLNLPIFEQNSPMPLDFRTRNEIESIE